MSKECQTHAMGEGNNGVLTGIIFSVPSPSWVSHTPNPPCAGFGSPEKREEITPLSVMRAVGKQASFS